MGGAVSGTVGADWESSGWASKATRPCSASTAWQQNNGRPDAAMHPSSTQLRAKAPLTCGTSRRPAPQQCAPAQVAPAQRQTARRCGSSGRASRVSQSVEACPLGSSALASSCRRMLTHLHASAPHQALFEPSLAIHTVPAGILQPDLQLLPLRDHTAPPCENLVGQAPLATAPAARTHARWNAEHIHLLMHEQHLRWRNVQPARVSAPVLGAAADRSADVG